MRTLLLQEGSRVINIGSIVIYARTHKKNKNTYHSRSRKNIKTTSQVMFRCLCCFFRLWKAAGFEAFSFCQPWPSTSFQLQPSRSLLNLHGIVGTWLIIQKMGFSFARVSQVLVPQNLRIEMRERSLKRLYIPQWRFSERSQFVQRNRMHAQLKMKCLLYQLYQAKAGTRHPAAAHSYSYNHLHMRHNLYVYI